MACLNIPDLTLDCCIVQKLDPVTSSPGTPIMTECDCPMFLMSSELYIVNSKSVTQSVSFVHVCSTSCHMNFISSMFIHDYSNRLFAFNPLQANCACAFCGLNAKLFCLF